MSIKRFVQLFIMYAISIIVAVGVNNLFHITDGFAEVAVLSLVGYVVLTIPLTIMTIKKNNNH